MIVDYSFARPTPAALRQAGVTGVLRYISHDGAKAATPSEVAVLHSAGLPTAFVFEDGAERAATGRTQGSADGLFAASHAVALGLPAGRPVYVSVDFDIPDYAPGSTDPKAKLGPVAEYLEGFAAELDAKRYMLGVYGGYWCVSRAYDAGLTAWTWQTTAWSGGMIFQRVRLYQPGPQIMSGEADLDLAATGDWGQWRHALFNLVGQQA